MLDRFFHERLYLNNYALVINFLGCLTDRATYRNQLLAFLNSEQAQGICQTCQLRKEKNIMRIFDCKNEQCQKIYENAPYTADHLCSACQQEWHDLQEALALLSVTFAYQPKLVRGLDYYSKTVFEFISNNLGAQNSFCGGGRYDQLVMQLGGKEDQPSLGAAIGIERMLLLLEPFKETLVMAQEPALHVIMPMDPEQHKLALLLADTLQAVHMTVEVLFDNDSIKSMMRQANKLGARYALILGQEEQETKSVMVKNMMTGAQERIAQIDLMEYLKK
jgi:histidyl-tRNA synthetase